MVLEEVEALKCLVLLDKNLELNLHIETQCNKIASGVFALRKMSFITNDIKIPSKPFILSICIFGLE